MPTVYSIDGITPVVDASAYVHPCAVVVGDVIVAARAYIGPDRRRIDIPGAVPLSELKAANR